MGLLRTVLAFAIAVVFAIFVAYGVYIFYEPPTDYEFSNCTAQWDCEKNINSCMDKFVNQTNKEDCWQIEQQKPDYKLCLEQRDTCEKLFYVTTNRYVHTRNSFFILVFIALVSLIAGIYLRRYEGIGSGILGGSVLVILWTLGYTWEYWTTFNKYLRWSALGTVLVVLLYLGYKKIDKIEKKSKKR